MQTVNGSCCQVFTPFSHAATNLPLTSPLSEPSPIDERGNADTTLATLREDGVLQSLEDIGLLDKGPVWWEETLAQHWKPGKLAARQQLNAIDS